MKKEDKWYRKLSGTVKVFVKGDDKSRFLNLIRTKGIDMWNIVCKENGYIFTMYAKDFYKLQKVRRKTHVKLKIIKKSGIPFLVKRYRKRKMFLFGFISACIMVKLLSAHMWDIEINGNIKHTKNEIAKLLRENNVECGMKIKDVCADKIEEYIRNGYSDIVWISCRVEGTKLIIDLKENLYVGQVKEELKENVRYDLVATEEMTISKIVTRRGTALVKAGDRVKKGDILIMGEVEVSGDYDEYIRTEYVAADGEVYGIVNCTYMDVLSTKYVKKVYTGREEKKISFVFNDNKIEIGKDADYEKADVITKEKRIYMTSGYYLPVIKIEKCYREYEEETLEYEKDEIERRLLNKYNKYLENLSKMGIQIVDKNVRIDINGGMAKAQGNIVLYKKCEELVECMPTPE